MKIGDRVKLLANMYDQHGDDNLMEPGTEGTIQSQLGGGCWIVILDHEVEGKRDWSFLTKELEVVQ
jgi:hypothetical protein